MALSVLAACSGGGSGGDSNKSADPIYGTWYYEMPGGSSTSAKGIVAEIKEGKVFFAYIYAYSSGGSIVMYHRKSEGTYTRNGNVFEMSYSYETCNPVGSETLELSVSGDTLTVYVPNSGIGILMQRSSGGGQIQSMIAIEDRNCNILSKIQAANQKKEKRTIASASKGSFFTGIELPKKKTSFPLSH
ncbi:MAG: hypothetical protein KF789_14700 [Bdellovibrionaceae bacterium]|nr:hypothetical protein [Pseudobdellovibrionaceae bacterium]